MQRYDRRRSPAFRFRPAVLVLVGASLGWGGVHSAEAQIPRADRNWLSIHQTAMRSLGPELRARADSPETALNAIRELLMTRAEALSILAQTAPLTLPNAMETQDIYDDTVVRILFDLTAQGLAAESSPPPQEDAIYYAAVIGEPPALGAAPIGFMSLGLCALALQTHDELQNDPAISAESASGLTLRVMSQAARAYVDSHEDELDEHHASQFRHNSVIMRMRCPKDDGTYRMTDQKNKMGAKDTFSTVYYLKCNICYEPYNLEFPLKYVSRLQQVSERQELKRDPQRVRPSDGLDP